MKRFPRTESLRSSDGSYSMESVYRGLERIAAGEDITPQRLVLIDRWFGVSSSFDWTPETAKHLLEELHGEQFDGKFRFARRATQEQLALFGEA